MILPQSFYEVDTVTVAKNLLGRYLVHLEGNGTTSGRIIETEAYPRDDPAAHSFHGRTASNSVLFGPAGYTHVFFVYGKHWCMNVVTGRGAGGEAVLIRALEPVEGIPVMQKRRGLKDPRLLCSGPGRLTQALAITGEYNGLPLNSGPLQIWSPDSPSGMAISPEQEIVETTRVGITKAKELLYRFYLKGNPYVSQGTERMSLKTPVMSKKF
jgi:DNA-3-methyladenine glycosylase